DSENPPPTDADPDPDASSHPIPDPDTRARARRWGATGPVDVVDELVRDSAQSVAAPAAIWDAKVDTSL
ncbi:hypothetical protein PV381_06950, partial [Streptomyces scabiei]|nr:hypothetical protein [Streptomyces scabiei]